jgi:Mrp family chromosome partitioning ATPase/capsular polysaccharide biosynthesis protein
MNNRSAFATRAAGTRVRLWIAVICAVAGAAVGAAVALNQFEGYAATAQVGFSRITIPTQASIARTPQVAAHALRLAGVDSVTPRALMAHTRVTAAPDTGVVMVRVTDARAEQARRLANAYAEAFVVSRRAQVVASTARLRRALNHELARLRLAVAQASDATRFLARTRYQAALRQALALRATAAVGQRAVFVAATAQTGKRVGAPLVRDAGLGLVVGLAAGLLLALVAGHRRRSAREFADALGAPVLGALPGSIALADDPRRQLRSRPVGDAVRDVRSRLLLARLPGTCTIAVAGATDSAHTAPTTLGLAFALAEIGRRVSVVDLDTGDPPLHWWMGRPGTPGIAEIVSGHLRVDEALVDYDRGGRPLDNPARVPNGVRMLPSGRLNGNPWDLVSSPAIEDLMRRLRRDSDVVLIACPPLVGGISTSGVVGLADALVAVVDLGSLDAATMEAVHGALDALPVTALGAVLVRPTKLHRPLARRLRMVAAPQY